MAAVFFYLSRYPNCYTKLAEEIRAVFSDGGEIKSGPRLASCQYLRACIDEALRISPPVGTTLWRDIPCDGAGPAMIDGWVVPEGTRVGVNIHSVHHNEAYFHDPWIFLPERFLDLDSENSQGQAQAMKMREASSPFSRGYRSCAGKPLAYQETSVTIAKTLWYFDFQVPSRLDLGNEKHEVFQLQDQQGSSHTGPQLMFTPGEHSKMDLVYY